MNRRNKRGCDEKERNNNKRWTARSFSGRSGGVEHRDGNVPGEVPFSYEVFRMVQSLADGFWKVIAVFVVKRYGTRRHGHRVRRPAGNGRIMRNVFYRPGSIGKNCHGDEKRLSSKTRGRFTEIGKYLDDGQRLRNIGRGV